MNLLTDDETQEVSNVFLGPKGWLFPWRARYSSYGVGFLFAVAAVTLERRIGVGLSPWAVIYTLAAVVLATRWVGRAVSFETPVRAIAATLAHEICAPRGDLRTERAVLIPGRVRVRVACGRGCLHSVPSRYGDLRAHYEGMAKHEAKGQLDG